MKTTILTGALLGLAAGSASAQSNVTVYGLLDTAVVLARGGPSGAFNKLESGVSNGSRLGLRGVEDLGGGISAIFTLESGILADSGASDQNGALLLRGAFNHSDNAAATDSARNTLLIAKYDFGSVAASLGYGANKGTRLVDSRDYIAAMSMPLGAYGLAATLIHKSDRAATGLGANQAALAYTYAFSKRTNLYLAYSKLSNIRFATSKFGDGDRELDIGIKHRF